ncbi:MULTISPECIES: hypothetical protein [unclassified Caballeronia]|jgi:hypothetical protein|uniref:hypothetical protein n=2 Tax=unclassified Caballeronia TaxID=2646786 RepID=UPI002027D91E|nr:MULTISPECIES: hypothetical protein [unclassified Caballeronia]MDR5773782.1 hypothetical protein [Caballeronia sp. LZ002]MDR5849217.1 hypothetical protein [Caballeronia sp. LZ003]
MIPGSMTGDGGRSGKTSAADVAAASYDFRPIFPRFALQRQAKNLLAEHSKNSRSMFGEIPLQARVDHAQSVAHR